MHISPYFRNLRNAYFAELDDLSQDSEGLYVLNQRLAQRRKEIEFLVHMLELSPEMVAVVFHKAFRFTSLAAMDHLLTHEAEDLPEWESLADTVELAPWAHSLVQTVRKQPMGDWFLCVAAALEYLYSKPEHPQAAPAEDGEADDVQRDAQHEGRAPFDGADDEDDEDSARARDEAGADWMVEQGFDRKD
ncbi:MAG: hypothetical protein WA174_14745 [Rhodoferax sp.]